jgi:NlpC/P60 family putative phage cell wall peptidase
MMVQSLLIKQLTPDTIIQEVRSWIGTPYIHQQRKKQVATDCIGLVYGVYSNLVGEVLEESVVPYSPSWAEEGNKDILSTALSKYLVRVSSSSRRKGSIVVFSFKENTAMKHVAFLSGDGCMIHAYGTHPVHETTLSPWWESRIRQVYELPNMEEV